MKLGFDFLRAFDHVIVRDDDPGGIDDEARAERALRRAWHRVAEDVRAGRALRGRGDLHDPGCAAPVDRRDVDRRGAGRVRRGARRRRFDHRRGAARLLVEGAERPGTAQRRAAAEKGGGDERGNGLDGGREPAGALTRRRCVRVSRRLRRAHAAVICGAA